ncbi:MAG: hypothetical protein J0I20_26120 [Chloroflexi bacterium]|nr:hypothetical protein [Chloroflexota bacterium]OJW06470.1 MAG: hypothetical protein BGO39_00175 [Chloroflexi bacterium 54-19]
MSDQNNSSFDIDPDFRQSLNSEQLATLEKIERLSELDPEVTRRLSRALDRLQQTQPYQQINQRSGQTSNEPEVSQRRTYLSEAEQLAHEEFVTQELSVLLAVAAQLNQAFETVKPQAQADRRFRDQLRAQFK